MMTELELFDNHTHALPHGLNQRLNVKGIAQAAVDEGLSSVCLTDHYPLPWGFEDPTEEKDCAMPFSLYGSYRAQVEAAKRRYESKIEVLKGAEFDWIQGSSPWIRKAMTLWQFDYTLGSVHFLGDIEDDKGWRNLILDYSEEEFLRGVSYHSGIRPLVEAYYCAVRDMVRTRFFDGVGHLDLIKKYNDGSLFSEEEPWYQAAVLNTLDVIQTSGMCLEINTAGLDKKCRASYPSLWILQEARERQIPVTIGSDGHTPETIGRNLEKAIELAKAAGYQTLVRYKDHRPLEIPLIHLP